MNKLTRIAVRRPRAVLGVMLAVTAALGYQFRHIVIDTDPENMLETDQPDRVFYDAVKADFAIRDLLVVGVVDEEGIFRPDALARIAALTDRILEIPGVRIEDVVSLRTTDDIARGARGVEIGPLLGEIPTDQASATAMLDRVLENPLLAEKLGSRDGTATAIYVPIESKDQSYQIGQQIQLLADEELAPEQSVHLAGLPVAEDTFGHEMFREMGVTAPLAGLVIFVLLWLLFGRVSLVVPTMVVAMLSIVWAMGTMIGLGFPVHIMSSMIPVFLMPIAVLDSVHLLSEFHDRYPETDDPELTIAASMRELYRPMLFTSLTTAVGFASLTLAPIPPVQVFGVFVAIGVLAAWILTITVIPASIMLVGRKRLRGLGEATAGRPPRWTVALSLLGERAFRRGPWIVASTVVLVVVAVAGVSRIVVNDNPVRWFKEGHPLRIADRVMNASFGGTYMAYLVVEADAPEALKAPEAMAYLDRLDQALEDDERVGRVTSIADVIRRGHQVLSDDGDGEGMPTTREAVGQYLFLIQTAGDPDELDNLIDYDARRANLWVQMRSGDNRDMQAVTDVAEAFAEVDEPPEGFTLRWSGLTYINKVWQELMVIGMLRAVLGSFLVVLVLMSFMFRSVRLGLVSMIPMSLAILVAYGVVGLVGKEYDMPIAVCSSLTLGLGIDFAIHFLQRFRDALAATGTLEAAVETLFGLPARAIARNALVVALGFLPLATSGLGPYVTVGVFFALLMLVSALATLVVLPALVGTAGRWMFSEYFQPA
ncbi:MAG: RND family transporter [Gemmatimonadota bacterium]